MYEDFNMGIGFEFIVSNDSVDEILGICEGYGIDVKVIGHCEKASVNSLIVESTHGRFSYQ